MFIILLITIFFTEGAFAEKIEVKANASFAKKMCHSFQKKAGESDDSQVVSASSAWSWFKISPSIKVDEGFGPKQIRNVTFTCANRATYQSRAENILSINCDVPFLNYIVSGANGEGSSVVYVDLETCKKIGEGSINSVSPDGRYLTLGRNADVDEGYGPDSAVATVFDCKVRPCKQIFKTQEYKSEGFENLKWTSVDRFEFERRVLADGDNQSHKCNLKINPKPSLECK